MENNVERGLRGMKPRAYALHVAESHPQTPHDHSVGGFLKHLLVPDDHTSRLLSRDLAQAEQQPEDGPLP